MDDSLVVEVKRGPIDGRLFFSRSPIYSGYFQAVTAIGFAGIVYDGYLAITYLHGSIFRFGWFFFFATGFAYSWLATVLNYRRLRVLNAEGVLGGLAEDSPLALALSVAAWGPMQSLFYSYLAMILMEAVIGHLFGR